MFDLAGMNTLQHNKIGLRSKFLEKEETEATRWRRGKEERKYSHLKVAFCRTGSNAGSMCSVMSSIRRGLPTRIQFSKDRSSLELVIVVTLESARRDNEHMA